MPTDRTLIKKQIATYARVLLEAAQSEDAVYEVYDQLDMVEKTIRGHFDLRNTLADGAMPAEARIQILNAVFADCNEVLLKLLAVMVERGECNLLAAIGEEYTLLAEEALGATFVDVTTVVELNDALRTKIKDKLAADLGTGIILREQIDASILGGIVMSTHGLTLDASINSQLENARIVLSTVPSGGEK